MTNEFIHFKSFLNFAHRVLMFYDYPIDLIRTGQQTIVPTISGGSASLMAHGMAVMPGRGTRALLWTWEAQRNWALEATRNLKAGEL